MDTEKLPIEEEEMLMKTSEDKATNSNQLLYANPCISG